MKNKEIEELSSIIEREYKGATLQFEEVVDRNIIAYQISKDGLH